MQQPIRIQELTNYTSIHWYLRRFKTGKCSKCFRVGKTQLAKKHSKNHERKIENYLELCPKCHLAYDRTEGRVLGWLNSLAKTHTHQNRTKPRACEKCLQSFMPKRRTRRFCSNSCSSTWKAKHGLTNKDHDPITGKWLALNPKKA